MSNSIALPSSPRRIRMVVGWRVPALLVVLTFFVSGVDAEEIKPIESDGTINVPAFRLPPSVYLSQEAKKALPRQPVDFGPQLEKLVQGGRVAVLREGVVKSMAAQLQHARDVLSCNVT